MNRLISVSEVGTLLDCERRGDFAYYGHILGGHTLRKRNPAVTLRRGRAWGRAVAAWQETGDEAAAYLALSQAVEDDAQEQRGAGVYSDDEHRELLAHLTSILRHYMTAERLPLERAEMELRVPLPSRTGVRASNRYAFQGFVDGLTREFRLPGLWVVENKLRDRLSTHEQVCASRQIRWYAWAAEQQLDEPVQGVIVEERLNASPKPVRILKSGKPSHDKTQLTTAGMYLAACQEHDERVNEETRQALLARDWQKRHPVFLRREEIAEAGRELISAGSRIAEMDGGHRWPIANRSPFTCPRCAFRDICDSPEGDLTDFEFELTEPKRLRPQKEMHEVSATIQRRRGGCCVKTSLTFADPQPRQFLSVLLYGPSGIGKSTAACSTPGPIIYANADGAGALRFARKRYAGKEIMELPIAGRAPLEQLYVELRNGDLDGSRRSSLTHSGGSTT
jgi:CRISPR/Cas system-associated exonuclease Cas4 (RecB family)